MQNTLIPGKEPLMVNKIGLGTWGLGGAFNLGHKALGWRNISGREACKMLSYAIEHGINLIDTAPIYGLGRAESLLGDVLEHTSREVIIITKAGRRFTGNGWTSDLSRNFLIQSCEQSLQRLKRDYLDIFLLHDPTYELVIKEQAIDTLNFLKEKGLVHSIGFSTMNSDTALALGMLGVFDIGEVECNLLNQQVISIIDSLTPNKMAWIALCPLYHGWLGGKYQNVTQFPKGDWRYQYFKSLANPVLSHIEQSCRILQSRLRQNGRTLALTAIQFVYQLKQFAALIVGSQKIKQLTEILEQVDTYPLSEEEMKWLMEFNADYYLSKEKYHII